MRAIGQPKRAGFVLVLAVCIGVRLATVLAFPSIFVFDRTGIVQGIRDYDTYAQNLLATGVYGTTPGVPDATIPPLYGYSLALVYAIFGRGYTQVALFQILLDVLSITMLIEIGRRLLPGGEVVGLLGGIFYALYPYLIFQNLTVIDTPLFTALLHAFVLLMVLLRRRVVLDRTTWVLAVLGGIVLGLSALSRPVIASLALCVAVWFLFRLDLRSALVRLLPVAIISGLILVPWTVRNYRVYGSFVTVGTLAGENFWEGNNSYTIPFLRAGYATQWIPTNISNNLTPFQANSRFFQEGLRFLRDNPGRIPELEWVKFLAYWSVDVFPARNPISGPTPVENYSGSVRMITDSQGNISLTGVPEDDPVTVYSQPLFDAIGRAVHRLYFGSLLFLALVGIVLTRNHWRDVALLWFVQISMTVMYVVIFAPATRYRVPSDPMLFLFSAFTLTTLWAQVKMRVYRHKPNPI